MGFESAVKGTLQIEMSYDLNFLATLKTGTETLEDGSRQRITQSVLLKTGYSIRPWLAIDALFSYVKQSRKVSFDDQINQVGTSGLGDAVLIAKFVISRMSENVTELQLGVGPKLPLGRSDLSNKQNITLNADLQPGSGSWDLINWAYYARQFTKRPTMVASARIVGRFNGENEDYLGVQTYGFGNSIQIYLGLGDQVTIGRTLISYALSIGARNAGVDRVNGRELENTGGRWIHVLPAFSWHLFPNSIIHIVPELPLYSYVGGTQLTPSFRMQIGYYHSLSKKSEHKSNRLQL
ncbi:MAG: hypothetical protein P1P86_00690 [Bacteroidales bacterium]|nr:hypothetical protein [Bacteroidales bacterium]